MKKIDIIKSLLFDENETTEGRDTNSFGGSEIKICILQRGWVFVGRFSQEGEMCILTDAFNIRTWGTTKGLGELASDGSTSTTKLDKVNDVRFHELTSVVLLDCEKKSWDKVLK